ncbi:alpha/beta fold hydrolase [Cohnella faecalis]|uniref:Alpha/beta hydrolase n=1 Tax=Cohnella faecalis TaxID=2315694 RepID=A0A398CIS3_9BACL|nr:alpha/beta hydrolase [Cohnella faecalis]RIE02633.1 alpha/beta hydrolase [Cohnella faecalis]
MRNLRRSTSTTMACQDEGTGTPIVLLHGYCGSHRYFEEILPILSAKYRVIVPDLRGHGSSSATEGVYKMEQLADDLDVLLDAMQLSKVFLFGHSLGGYVTLAFAQRHRERLLGYGLLHSTSLPDTGPGKTGRLKAVDQIRTGGISPFVDELIPKLFAKDHRETMKGKINFAKEIGYGTAPQGAIGCALGMRERSDRTNVLEMPDLPVLLLAGEKDDIITPDRRFPILKPKPHLTQVTLKGVGHMGMLEAPQEFADALISFIAANEGSGGA